MGSAPLTREARNSRLRDRYRASVDCPAEDLWVSGPPQAGPDPRRGSRKDQGRLRRRRREGGPTRSSWRWSSSRISLDQALSNETRPHGEGEPGRHAAYSAYVPAATTALLGDRNPGILPHREALRNVTSAAERLRCSGSWRPLRNPLSFRLHRPSGLRPLRGLRGGRFGTRCRSSWMCFPATLPLTSGNRTSR